MGFLSDVTDSITDAVSDAWDSAKDWGSDIAEAGRTFFDDPLEGVGDLVKTSFKPVEWLVVNPLKETWENKYGRMGMIAAGTYLTGGALAGAGGTAGATGTASAGLSGTVAPVGGVVGAGGAGAAGTAAAGGIGTVAPVGGVVGAGGSGAAGLAGPTAAGAGSAAASNAASSAASSGLSGPVQTTNSFLGPTTQSAVNSMQPGYLSQAANWAQNNQLLASTGLNMAGQGISGYMQGKQLEEEREREKKRYNERSAYGVTYDGTQDAGIDSGGLLNRANSNYRPGANPNQPAAGPQNVADPNAQQTPWWQRQGGRA